MTVAGGGGIFISYRRLDSSHLAGRLADHLADRFGEDQVFIDVDTIEPGMDFAEEISRAVAACKVLLAVIGPAWLTAVDERSRRRLDDPDDIVRLEVEAALARGVWVIPILTEGAVMPDRHDLPDSLANLARRNAITIRHESFRSDARRLIMAIERALAGPGTATASISPSAHGARSAEPSSTGTVHQSTAIPAAEVPVLPDDEPQEILLGQAARQDQEAINDSARVLIDPERFAESLTDTADRAYVLFRISTALAATKPDRAARLLADAERIAWSIPDERSRASVLASIATALATADPDHAERLARHIPDEVSRNDALASIATALATTNPDHAERLAQSITLDGSKALALANIAALVAPTDPKRAARIIGNAERIARSFSSEGITTHLLTGIAATLATASPDHAERIARDIPDARSRAGVLASIAETTLATTNPDRAERIAQSIPGGFRIGGPAGTVTAVAATDPGRAVRIARAIPDESSRNHELAIIATTVAVTDPDRAEGIAQILITDKDLQVRTVASIAMALVATDPDRAVRLIAKVEQNVQSLRGSTWRRDTLVMIAEAEVLIAEQLSRYV